MEADFNKKKKSHDETITNLTDWLSNDRTYNLVAGQHVEKCLQSICRMHVNFSNFFLQTIIYIYKKKTTTKQLNKDYYKTFKLLRYFANA